MFLRKNKVRLCGHLECHTKHLHSKYIDYQFTTSKMNSFAISNAYCAERDLHLPLLLKVASSEKHEMKEL